VGWTAAGDGVASMLTISWDDKTDSGRDMGCCTCVSSSIGLCLAVRMMSHVLRWALGRRSAPFDSIHHILLLFVGVCEERK
jgi:hypothetical protein